MEDTWKALFFLLLGIVLYHIGCDMEEEEKKEQQSEIINH